MSVFLRVVAICFLVTLVALLLGPGTPIEREIVGLDKVAHFGAFGLLLWSIGILFRHQPRVYLAAYAIFFGALIELVQGVIGRDASWLDLLADALGVMTALAVWGYWRRFQPRSATNPGLSPSLAKTSPRRV